MHTESVIRNILRIWLAGTMAIGDLLLQVGPFIGALAGWVGWIATQHKPAAGRGQTKSDATEAPRFTMR